MYAVIQTGGKQYRVQPGTVVQIEKLEGAEKGKAVTFDNVLFTSAGNAETAQILIGKPTLAGAKVQAECVGTGRGEKILIVKMKRRKQYRRTQGHRQEQIQVLITGIDNGAGQKAELSATDKKAALTKFQSHLKPRGLAMTPKTLGSRKRMAAAKAETKTAKAAPAKTKK